MNAIGGFLELETRRGSQGAWHSSAVALTSGRACLHAVLAKTQPSRVLVPFYICDAALEPMRRLEIPIEFYSLTESLDPSRRDWPADAAVVVVNYFDLKNETVGSVCTSLGERAVVDDTHAFFRRGRGPSYSFNSARKFFGVPDGAYAYGPAIHDIRPTRHNDTAPTAHLSTRLSGDLHRAYAEYKVAEARVSCDVLLPSRCAEELLAGIAYAEAHAARRRNFVHVHNLLGDANTLAINFVLDADAAPSYYPFLPSGPSLHEKLWRRSIFVPRLWPELAARVSPGFHWEGDLANRLLALPIDHRYGCDDMRRVCEAVREVAE